MPKKKSNLSGLNILLGVSGGVAAYKAVDLASRLTAGGAKVNTIMTVNACRLIGPKASRPLPIRQFTPLCGTQPKNIKSAI